MPIRETPVFKLRTTFRKTVDGKEESVHPVMFWGDYGVVCPSMWTTNGSFKYLSKLTVEYIAAGSFEAVETDIPLEAFLDAGLLEVELRKRWVKHKENHDAA